MKQGKDKESKKKKALHEEKNGLLGKWNNQAT